MHLELSYFWQRRQEYYNGAQIPSSIYWCLENCTTTCKRMKLEPFLTLYTKINSKWIKDLNVRPETIILLEENIGRTLNDINQSMILYDPSPWVMEIKPKVNMLDLIKLKTFFKAKDYKQDEKTTLRLGENSSKWNNWQRINFQNMQAAHTSQYQKKINNLIKKWETDLNRHFSKEDIQMVNKHIKRCSTSLIIQFSSVQLLSRVRLCDPMSRSTPGLPVHHQLPEFIQTHY